MLHILQFINLIKNITMKKIQKEVNLPGKIL